MYKVYIVVVEMLVFKFESTELDNCDYSIFGMVGDSFSAD